MSRPLRVEIQGAYYHVMNRGLSRTRIFLDETDYQAQEIVEDLEAALEQFRESAIRLSVLDDTRRKAE